MTEQRKILEMLASGQLKPDEAENLLDALGSDDARSARPKGATKLLHISIDAEDEAKIRVNVPLSLAKFATQFIPKDARNELDRQGINLSELLSALGDDLPEGRLVDVVANDEDEQVKIVVEIK